MPAVNAVLMRQAIGTGLLVVSLFSRILLGRTGAGMPLAEYSYSDVRLNLAPGGGAPAAGWWDCFVAFPPGHLPRGGGRLNRHAGRFVVGLRPPLPGGRIGRRAALPLPPISGNALKPAASTAPAPSPVA